MYCDLWPYVLWPLDFQIQKRIVSAETIWENTVFGPIRRSKLALFFILIFERPIATRHSDWSLDFFATDNLQFKIHRWSTQWMCGLGQYHYADNFQPYPNNLKFSVTGKSFSEALILVSTNPQYDKRLFIELRVQYMKIPSSEHVENMLCTQIVFCFDIQNNLCTQHVLSMFWACSELAIFMYWTCDTMNNLLSYCGLFDARISASEKYLPVI